MSSFEDIETENARRPRAERERMSAEERKRALEVYHDGLGPPPQNRHQRRKSDALQRRKAGPR